MFLALTAISSFLAIAMMTGKGAAKSKPAAASAGKRSPGKKAKGRRPMAKGASKRNKPHFTLICTAFHEHFHFEGYIYEKNPTDDGFLNVIREFVHEDKPVPKLNAANIVDLLPHRMPNTNNIIMKGNNGFW